MGPGLWPFSFDIVLIRAELMWHVVAFLLTMMKHWTTQLLNKSTTETTVESCCMQEQVQPHVQVQAN